MKNYTTYDKHLEVGQKIWVYWRFEAMGNRFYKAAVTEVADDYVVVNARGASWKIGPENEGEKLEFDYDKNDNLYLTGPFGLKATKLEEYYRESLARAYGGRVFIHPEQTWPKWQEVRP